MSRIEHPKVSWLEHETEHHAYWLSTAGIPAPRHIVPVDDTLPADTAFRHASEGRALLWRGDFHNARQLLSALMRRIDQRQQRSREAALPITDAPRFHQHRMQQAQRARTLGQILLPLEPGFSIPLRRAPDIQTACKDIWHDLDGAALISLRDLQGIIGAYEWRRQGIEIPSLGARIHPHYGVFSPVRGEYLELVAQAPLPAALNKNPQAFDLGTGTGVIAALLAKRGVAQIAATDSDPHAIECAQENLQRLGFADRVSLHEGELFPAGKAALIVCNPPWLPGKPGSAIEHAVYDPESRMLKAFLAGVASHLSEDGEAWLILSDLAEHLGLRSRETLLQWIGDAGLKIVARHDTKPVHRKTQDTSDPLHAARARELTSLWRLRII